MKSILDIISGVSELTSSGNLVQMFTLLQEFNELDFSDSKELQQLIKLKTALLKWNNLTTKQNVNSTSESMVCDHSPENILRLQQECQRQYAPLHDNYVNLQLSRDPTLAILASTSPAEQIDEISQYNNWLLNQQDVLNNVQVQSELLELINTKNHIVSQLKTLHVIVNADHLQLKNRLEERLSSSINLQKQLATTFQQLADIMTYQNKEKLQKKIKNLKSKLKSCQDELKAFSLDELVKQFLDNEYGKSEDEEDLINRYEQDYNNSYQQSFLLRLLPKTNEQLVTKEKLSYLKKRHDASQLSKTIDSLTQQCSELAMFSTPPTVPAGVDQLIACLLNELSGQPVVFNGSPDLKSQLTTVSELLPKLARHIDNLKEACDLTNTLIHLDAKIVSHITQIGFIGTENQLVLSLSTQMSKSKPAQVLNYQEQLERCKEYLDNMSKYTRLTSKKVRGKPRQRKTSIEITQLEKLINETASGISALNQSLLKSDVTSDEVYTPPQISHPATKFRSTFSQLHNNCHKLSFRLSNLKSWYNELLTSLLDNCQTNYTYHLQAVQLLNDIEDELHAAIDESKLRVLPAYHDLCPNPSKNWNVLLSLKPAVTIDSYVNTTIKNPEIKKIIDKIFDYATMGSKNSVKQNLLRQAAQNLQHIALVVEQKPEGWRDIAATVNFWRKDPHYSSIFLHHGFFMLCELMAKMITRLCQGVDTMPKLDYKNSFFYKRTTSERLLDECVDRIIFASTTTSA